MGKTSKEKFELRIKGSNSGVTGTSYHLELVVPNQKTEEYLVDCGVFQEKENLSLNEKFLFEPRKIKAVFLSHYHADHSGQIPVLFEKGFSGKVFASHETGKQIKMTAMSNFYSNNKSGALNYSEASTLKMMASVEEIVYDTEYEISEHCKVRMFSNSHCRGASMFLFICEYKEEKIYTLFTGDYKHGKFPTGLAEYTDVPINIVTEGTYGARKKPKPKFFKCLEEVIEQKRHLFIMATGADRYEEVLKKIEQAYEQEVISEDPLIFLETKKNFEDAVDADKVITFSDAKGRQEAIWERFPSFVVVTTRGNVEYFVEHMASDENATIIFTNYVSEKSKVYSWITTPKGSDIFVGKKPIKKMADIIEIRDFGGHAFVEDIVKFLKHFNNINSVFIGHGEKFAKREIVEVISEELEINRNKVYTFKRGSAYKVTKDEAKYYR